MEASSASSSVRESCPPPRLRTHMPVSVAARAATASPSRHTASTLTTSSGSVSAEKPPSSPRVPSTGEAAASQPARISPSPAVFMAESSTRPPGSSSCLMTSVLTSPSPTVSAVSAASASSGAGDSCSVGTAPQAARPAARHSTSSSAAAFLILRIKSPRNMNFPLFTQLT